MLGKTPAHDTAPYSPTTTCKIERLHKTIRTELLSERTFTAIEQAQAELDSWVRPLQRRTQHQGIADVPPIRRFELVQPTAAEVIDPEIEPEDDQGTRRSLHRVDRAGWISILKTPLAITLVGTSQASA